MLREVDVEPRDRGFELGPRLGLEGELALDRPRDAGREQRLLLGLGQGPESGEGLAVVPDLQPVERQVRAVVQHGLARRPVGEVGVVHPGVGPVRGLLDRDVEGVVVVAMGKHGTAHLEHREVEGGREVAGKMRLHQRGADAALIVGEPDADAHLLARLGLAVPRPRHGLGDGRSGGGNAMGRGVRVVAVGGPGCRAAGLLRLRHVLGLDQAGDDLERAVIADRDDAAGHPEVLAPVDRAGLDGGLDLVEPRLDAFALGGQLFGPVLVVEIGELVVAGLQPLDLGLLLVGRRTGLRLDAAVARGVVPPGLDHGNGPLPAGRQLIGGRLELAHRHLLQQHWVLEPDAVLVLVGEQVAHDRAAGGLIGLHADEAGDRRRARHPLLGQQALHLPGGGPVALGRDLFPDRHLALAVGGDGEGLQHLEVDLVRPVGVQQFRGGVAEAQALLDDALGGAEARRDGRNRLAGPRELGESHHLVGRVHGDAHDVLGERDLAGLGVAGPDLAGHRTVGVERLVLDQRLHGLQAAPAGDDGVAFGAVLVRLVGADDQILQQAEGGDRSLQLGVGPGIGRGLADILRREREPGEWDLPDERLGLGGDEVHGEPPSVMCGKRRKRRGDRLPPAPSAPPGSRPAPPPGGVAGRDGARRQGSLAGSAAAFLVVAGLDPVGRPVQKIGGLAQRARGVADAAHAHMRFGREVGIGGPGDPEGEPG